MNKCSCGERNVNECDEEWGPDCDLGNNEKYVKVSQVNLSAPEAQCAQCKKGYRHGTAAGCPKCAPGVVVPESEFREPIATAPAPAVQGKPVALTPAQQHADELLGALQDMLDGWRYIRRTHGDLYGVGWDRAENKAIEALAKATGTAAGRTPAST